MKWFSIKTHINESIDSLKKRIDDVSISLNLVQESSQAGLQNVYNKFLELENRQKEIEELLKSDRIHEAIKAIPTVKDIEILLSRVEYSEIPNLNKHLEFIKKDLNTLYDLFCI